MQDGQAAGIDGLDGVRRRVSGQQGGGDVLAECASQGLDGVDAGQTIPQPVVAQDDVGPATELEQFGPDLVGGFPHRQGHAPMVEDFHHGAQNGLVIVDEGHQGVFQGERETRRAGYGGGLLLKRRRTAGNAEIEAGATPEL